MDLTTGEVAELLGVSLADVSKWAQSGALPHYEMGGELRFGREELETWMLSNESQLEQATLQGLKEGKGAQHFSLYRAINRGGVLSHIQGKTKEEVIREAVSEIANSFELDCEVLTELLLDRERLASTGLGHGLAFPHTRDFFLGRQVDVVTVVLLDQPVPFDAIDGKPVFALFFLLASDSKRHLHLLSKLAHLNHDHQFREFLRAKPNKGELLNYIKEWEHSLLKAKK